MFAYLQYIIGALAGLAFGFLFHKLAIFQINKRTDDVNKQNYLKKPFILPAWLLLSAALFVVVLLREQDLFRRIEYLIYISIVLNIAFVDYVVCKIPNELLITLLLVKVVFVIIALANSGDLKETLMSPAFGLVVGFVLFLIPSMFGVMIGAGDIKYCAVIGFCLGFKYYLQAMAIMAVALLIYLVYLMITKKGNLKTVAAMGPYLSLGVVLTVIYPFF